MSILKKIPIPLSGVMLGFAALGNLLASYSETIRYICGFISFVLAVVLILKLIFCTEDIKTEFKNPIMLSVSATFPMGIMLLSVYAKPFIGEISKFIWFSAIIIHILIIAVFTYRFIFKLEMKKVFASYFIVYVGIAVAGITAPAYGLKTVGQMAFWFGFVSLILLLPVIIYRYSVFKDIPEPAKPLFCIFAAPTSLCLTAYLQSFDNKKEQLVLFMFILALVLYIVSLIKLFSFLKLKFYPSYASFTFPFVISAIAVKQTAGFLKLNISFIVTLLTIIAVILVVYTFIKFMVFIFEKPKVILNNEIKSV